MEGYSVIGKRVPKRDAIAKAMGAARFTDDLVLPRMLYGKILRSPHSHARIVAIDISKAEKLPGVKAVITGKDTAAVKFGVFRETRDQYPLPMEKVRYLGEEVAAVAAIDEEISQEALGLIKVEYEVLPALFDPEEAIKDGAPRVHEDVPNNINVHVCMSFGDIERGFAESGYVRQDRFVTEAISHCQMEPYAAVASFESGKLDVWVPNQSPFTKRRALAVTLKLPLDSVRVHHIYIGGAFGGRSEMLPCEFCAALLSMKAGRPVKIRYTREETFTCTRQKHPFIIDIRTGAKRDGTLLARDIRVVADGGAYINTGPITVSDSVILLLALYRTPNVRYEGFRVYTNKPVRGAMKGQGNQQLRFADESQVNMIAEDLGIDPVEIRLRNAVHAGDMLPNRSKVHSCGLSESILKSAASAGWKKKRGNLPPGRGIGIGCSPMISGFHMGVRTTSAAFLKFNEDGQATLLIGAVDNGQGNETMVAQVAAEELGIRLDDIKVINADTETTPQDPGSYSMACTFVSGNAAKAAAGDAKRQLLSIAAEELEANEADLDVRDGQIFVKGSLDKGMSLKDAVWTGLRRGNPVLGKGYFMPEIDRVDAVGGKIEGQMTGAYSFGTTIAEVEVDKETGMVRVLNVAAAHDCGYAINPMAVEGQIEGSVVIGQGQVLSEILSFEGGQVLNPDFTNYGFPTSLETPAIDPIIVEAVDPNGPFGAKEAAETINIAIVPALADAIYDAVGMRINSLPITPEKVLRALRELEERAKGG